MFTHNQCSHSTIDGARNEYTSTHCAYILFNCHLHLYMNHQFMYLWMARISFIRDQVIICDTVGKYNNNILRTSLNWLNGKRKKREKNKIKTHLFYLFLFWNCTDLYIIVQAYNVRTSMCVKCAYQKARHSKTSNSKSLHFNSMIHVCMIARESRQFGNLPLSIILCCDC